MSIPRYRYAAKKKRKGGSRFKQGYYTPKNPEKYHQPIDKTMNSGELPFMRSSWERKFAVWCDNNPEVIKWGCEVIHIPYFDTQQNKKRRYFPDFFVEFKNGTKVIIEIKPAAQCPKENSTNPVHLLNKSKWVAARQYCKQIGAEFVIMTEKELGIK